MLGKALLKAIKLFKDIRKNKIVLESRKEGEAL